MGVGDGAEDRFDRLLADVAARAAAEEVAEDHTRAEELARAEATALTLPDRLAGMTGGVGLGVAGVGRIDGRVTAVGSDVLRVEASDGSEYLVPLGALLWLEGLAGAPPTGARSAVDRRLGLAAAVRRWVRDRRSVAVVLRDGSRRSGTPDRAYADHLDLAEHDPDEPRRSGAVRRVSAVPYAAVAAIIRRAR